MTAAEFSRILIDWYESNPRPMPWKESKNPYLIWISEIILQQTRVDQGTPYYQNFTKKFPTIFDLAAADESEVLKTWEGLGYYSRARNLHFTARQIVNTLNGNLPDEYESLIKLKGVGPYSAAAICSFAYEKKVPAIDGNVTRFVARLLGISEPLESSDFKSQVKQFAIDAIHHAVPSEFNQAMINFGAMLCKPLSPNCGVCPFQSHCKAYRDDMIAFIPFKSKKLIKKERYFHFFHISSSDGLMIEKREYNDIWKNLYTLPYVETTTAGNRNPEELTALFKAKYLIYDDLKPEIENVHFFLKQTLTHQIIQGNFYHVAIVSGQIQIKQPFNLVESKNLSNFAFPKIIRTYFSETGLLSCIKS